MGEVKKQVRSVEGADMITEKSFASSHRSFWAEITPLLSHFVKKQDAYVESVFAPLERVTVDDRGLVGELATRLFATAHERRVGPGSLSPEEIQDCVGESVNFIQRFRAYPRRLSLTASANGTEEAKCLADRLHGFFGARETRLRLWPEFPGCGWLDTVQGDALGARTLYEVKCGKARVRGKDVKQILCYLALNYASKTYPIDQIGLINPRTGVVLGCTVDSLCQEVGGRMAPGLLADIVEHLSTPRWEVQGV